MFYYHNLIVERALRALSPKCNRPVKKCGIPTITEMIQGRPSSCFMYEVGETEETDSGAFLLLWTVTIRTGSKQAYCTCPDHERGLKILCPHIASVLYYERAELMPFVEPSQPQPENEHGETALEQQLLAQAVEGVKNPTLAKEKLRALRSRWRNPAYRQSRYGSPDFLPMECEPGGVE